MVAPTHELEAQLASVLERLNALEDERAVVDVLTRYCHAMDVQDVDAWLDLFTEDAFFAFKRTPTDDKPRSIVRGREQLREWFQWHAGLVPGGVENHLLVNPRVQLDGDRARSVGYWVGVRDENSTLEIPMTGRWEDQLVREADGAWRIAERWVLGDMPRNPPPSPLGTPPAAFSS